MKGISGQPISHLSENVCLPKKSRHISYKLVAFISCACQPSARYRDASPHMLVSKDKSLESSIIPDIIGHNLDFKNQISTMNYLPML